jgi:hypothetical protein
VLGPFALVPVFKFPKGKPHTTVAIPLPQGMADCILVFGFSSAKTLKMLKQFAFSVDSTSLFVAKN